MKPLDLARKVASLGLALRKKSAAESAHDAHDVEPARSSGALARRATVRILHVTTLVAKQMQRMPMPKPRAAERVALSLASSQLRALVGGALVRDSDARDRESPEGALLELVHHTLALVDKALAMDPELARDETPVLAREGEAGEGGGSESPPPSASSQPARKVFF
jgi:hypothetical protein